MKFYKSKQFHQGFTLIELLVVIAIIGILAAMVISNLRIARLKARDASAITTISSARAEAENYYDGNGLSYGNGTLSIGASVFGTQGGICDITTPTPFGKMIQAAHNANLQTSACVAQDQTYTAEIPLAALDGDFVFCIDSSGFAGKIPANGVLPNATPLPPFDDGYKCQ